MLVLHGFFVVRSSQINTKGDLNMQVNSIQGEAKSITLDNGATLYYCERGEENAEVVIMTGFFFHTFMPLVDGMAKKYHVYGLVMRFDGPAEERNADGSINWCRMWGRDEYEFCRKLGIEKFIHFGKCHGSVPGWYMVKEHPEMLTCFASFFLAPHVKGQNSSKWFDTQNGGDIKAMMAAGIRKVEAGLPKKMAEAQALGLGQPGGVDPAVMKTAVQDYAAHPEKIWPTVEACDQALQNMMVPVGYLFGTEDPLFEDFYDSNMYAIFHTRGSKTTFLQGECHLMEIDCPERVVDEMMNFIDQCKVGYYKEIMA